MKERNILRKKESRYTEGSEPAGRGVRSAAVIRFIEDNQEKYYQMFYYNIDLDTGKDITLREWFGSNYKKIIADEVQKQIDTWDDEKKFYLWEDLDLEDLINEDTQFYINDKEQVVIFFNKYELGAGAMGTPEFVIDVH